MWPNTPRPLIIGHRGSPIYAPENTLASFEMAAAQGADAIEFDVKLTADGEVVILHDATVDRTTNGHGRLKQFTLAAVQALDAGGWFSPRFAGERIPTLEAVCAAFGPRVYLNIELTNYTTPFDPLVLRVAEIVKKYHLQERVLFSSFFPRNLALARRLLPASPCALLAFPGWKGYPALALGLRSRNYWAIHPHITQVTPALVQRAHAAGKRIHVWTVNAEADIRRMADIGVDAFFTDDVAKAHRILRGK